MAGNTGIALTLCLAVVSCVVSAHPLSTRYFAGSQMYFLNSLDRRVDNTDQRLTQDVDNFTVTGGQLLFGNYVTQASIAYVLSSVITATYNVAPKVGAVPLLWITLYVHRCTFFVRLARGCMHSPMPRHVTSCHTTAWRGWYSPGTLPCA